MHLISLIFIMVVLVKGRNLISNENELMKK